MLILMTSGTDLVAVAALPFSAAFKHAKRLWKKHVMRFSQTFFDKSLFGQSLQLMLPKSNHQPLTPCQSYHCWLLSPPGACRCFESTSKTSEASLLMNSIRLGFAFHFTSFMLGVCFVHYFELRVHSSRRIAFAFFRRQQHPQQHLDEWESITPSLFPLEASAKIFTQALHVIVIPLSPSVRRLSTFCEGSSRSPKTLVTSRLVTESWHRQKTSVEASQMLNRKTLKRKYLAAYPAMQPSSDPQ